MFVSPKKITSEIINATQLLPDICKEIITPYIQAKNVNLLTYNEIGEIKMSILLEDGQMKYLSMPCMSSRPECICQVRFDNFYFVMIETKCYKFYPDENVWILCGDCPRLTLAKLLFINNKIYACGFQEREFLHGDEKCALLFMCYDGIKWEDVTPRKFQDLNIPFPLAISMFYNKGLIYLYVDSFRFYARNFLKTIDLSSFEVKDLERYPRHKASVIHNNNLYLFTYSRKGNILHIYDGNELLETSTSYNLYGFDDDRITLFSNNKLIFIVNLSRCSIYTFDPLTRKFQFVNSF